ncbi:hypothetical protein [Nocardia niigatensis]|uniref:hypothetical protein n=1 Tax=Nocardia niigatensis TaxID=209249 RepID=UPI0002FBF4EF|nr:hypothetical protein [Nocardia niigatensis]
MNTELITSTCEVLGHQWSSVLPSGHCRRCGIPAVEVLAWDRHGQLLGTIPTGKDHTR